MAKRQLIVEWREHTSHRSYFTFDDEEYTKNEIVARLDLGYADSIWDELERSGSEIDGGIQWDSVTYNFMEPDGTVLPAVMYDMVKE